MSMQYLATYVYGCVITRHIRSSTKEAVMQHTHTHSLTVRTLSWSCCKLIIFLHFTHIHTYQKYSTVAQYADPISPGDAIHLFVGVCTGSTENCTVAETRHTHTHKGIKAPLQEEQTYTHMHTQRRRMLRYNWHGQAHRQITLWRCTHAHTTINLAESGRGSSKHVRCSASGFCTACADRSPWATVRCICASQGRMHGGKWQQQTQNRVLSIIDKC